MPLQDYQVGSNDLISAMFQRRFEPNFALGNAVGILKMLAQLHGLWAMSSVGINGEVYDYSEQDHTLTNAGTTPFAVDGLAAYADMDGATQYLYHANHPEMEVTGALTAGGWFWVDSLAADRTLLSKWNTTGNQRSYTLTALTTGAPRARVSSNGTAETAVSGTAGDIVVNSWNFAAIRYTPSTELAVFLNKKKYVNVTSIPAAIFDSTSRFKIGGINSAASLDGRATLCFLSAAAQSDAMIGVVYEQTRALFGVGVTV